MLTSEDRIVADWLTTSARTGRLLNALHDHARRDLAEMIVQVAPLLPAPKRDVAKELLASRDAHALVQDSIACAGWHLARGESSRRQALMVALAETAARMDATIEFQLPISDLLLPMSGIRATSHSRNPLVLSARPGEIRANWGGGQMTLDTNSNEARAVGDVYTSKTHTHAGIRILPENLMLDSVIFSDKAAFDTRSASRSRLDEIIRYLHDGVPDLFEQMQKLSICIYPVAPRSANTIRMSWSDRRARNVVCLGVGSADDTLELLIHEFAHLKLCLLQEQYDLLEDHQLPALAPWRPDRRKVDGVLHGVYVFYAVAQAFTEAREVFPWSERQSRRVALWIVCVDEGLRQLRLAGARPTAAGRILVDRISEWADAALGNVRALNPAHYAWSTRVVREHLLLAGTSMMRDPWFLAE